MQQNYHDYITSNSKSHSGSETKPNKSNTKTINPIKLLVPASSFKPLAEGSLRTSSRITAPYNNILHTSDFDNNTHHIITPSVPAFNNKSTKLEPFLETTIESGPDNIILNIKSPNVERSVTKPSVPVSHIKIKPIISAVKPLSVQVTDEKPVTEAPAPEKPTTEVSIVDSPIDEAPAPEKSIEVPVAEVPVTEKSIEAPVAEAPVAEVPAPAPIVEAPIIEAPIISPPNVGGPIVKLPAPIPHINKITFIYKPFQVPTTADSLVVETRAVEVPVTETPIPEDSAPENHASENPVPEASVIEPLVSENLVPEITITDTPVINIPTNDISRIKLPTIDSPIVKPFVPIPINIKQPVFVLGSILTPPIVDSPIAEGPSSKPSIIETHVIETPTVSPVVENSIVPVVETPVVETPTIKIPIVEAPVVKAPAVSPSTAASSINKSTQIPSTYGFVQISRSVSFKYSKPILRSATIHPPFRIEIRSLNDSNISYHDVTPSNIIPQNKIETTSPIKMDSPPIKIISPHVSTSISNDDDKENNEENNEENDEENDEEDSTSSPEDSSSSKENNTDLPWDGTNLGELTDDNILEQLETITVSNKKLYVFRLKINDKYPIGLGYSTENGIPCITDQLKPMFNITPAGSHFFKYKSFQYFIIRYFEDLSYYDRLSDINIDELTVTYKLKIRRLFIYRDIIGTFPNAETNILIDKRQILDPISLSENIKDATLNGIKTRLSKECVNRWLKDDEIRYNLTSLDCKMINTTNFNHSEYIASVKTTIQDTMLRIDGEHISFVNAIIDRIQSRINPLTT